MLLLLGRVQVKPQRFAHCCQARRAGLQPASERLQRFLGQFAEAAQTLQPLADKGPVAAEARLWLGKAQVGLASSAEEGEPAQKAWSEALATLRSNGTLSQLATKYLQIYTSVPTIQP